MHKVQDEEKKTKAVKPAPETQHTRQCQNIKFSCNLCHKTSSSYIHWKQQLKDRSVFCPRGLKIGAQRAEMLHSKPFGVILLAASQRFELVQNSTTAATLMPITNKYMISMISSGQPL